MGLRAMGPRSRPEAAPQLSSLAFCLTLFSTPAFGACGDNRGPGYRNQAGKCVDWEALARQCGNPPSTKRAPETSLTDRKKPAEKSDYPLVDGSIARTGPVIRGSR